MLSKRICWMNHGPLWRWPAAAAVTLLLSVTLTTSMRWFNVKSIFFNPTPTFTRITLNCPNRTEKCPTPTRYPTSHNPLNPSRTSCPSYFRWIHEDLRPWKSIGVSRAMVEGAGKYAHFRLVILNGTAFVEEDPGKRIFQSRDLFTIWGILQLLRLYPGKVPDLELMFQLGDVPVVRSREFRGEKARPPPPLFRYCSDEDSLDIVFPDWTFWGWAEVNIKPWEKMLDLIKQGNKRIKWEDRVPYAYWKGNPNVALIRKELMKCNVSREHDWKSRLYIQDWREEINQGFKNSNLEDQCTHRYKIYVEGQAWSVSEKYILACNSMTMCIKSRYFDFFNRGLEPLQHYWPIRDHDQCKSLKFAVEWGNNCTEKAKAIGEAAFGFMEENLKMKFVYDYILHLLIEYAKLLKFKPEVPRRAVEICPERLMCVNGGMFKKFVAETLVVSPSDDAPCAMPPPYDAAELRVLLEKKANVTKEVERWEDEYWEIRNK